VAKEKMCIFGDRLYTDIAVGKHHGITAVLVYTGETQEADVAAAKEEDKPDFIFNSLDDVDKALFPTA
jgi:ribonucleotide monophosphatase NagD (HAD superfamily)